MAENHNFHIETAYKSLFRKDALRNFQTLHELLSEGKTHVDIGNACMVATGIRKHESVPWLAAESCIKYMKYANRMGCDPENGLSFIYDIFSVATKNAPAAVDKIIDRLLLFAPALPYEMHEMFLNSTQKMLGKADSDSAAHPIFSRLTQGLEQTLTLRQDTPEATFQDLLRKIDAATSGSDWDGPGSTSGPIPPVFGPKSRLLTEYTP